MSRSPTPGARFAQCNSDVRAALDHVEREFLRTLGRAALAGTLSLELYVWLVGALRRRRDEILEDGLE